MKNFIINLPLEEKSNTPELLQQLQFQLLRKEEDFEIFTDGSILIRLDRVQQLDKAIILKAVDRKERSFTDPAGVALHWKEETWFQEQLDSIVFEENQILSPCGQFYEISIGVADDGFKPTIVFWQRQGFKIVENDPDKHSYVTLQWGDFKLSVYKKKQCNHIFKSPALTYFEGDMANRIEQIKALNVSFEQELPNKDGKTDSAVLQTQEGIHFFLFAY